MTFTDACAAALARSETPDYDGCTIHVNARVVMRDGWPYIDYDAFTVTDWYADGLTVKTYLNGRERP